MSVLVAVTLLAACAAPQRVADPRLDEDWPALRAGAPRITAPPEAFFAGYEEGEERAVARNFYRKHIDIRGISVAAAGEVDDEALQRAWYLVNRILAGRPDIHGLMARMGTRLIIMGRDQLYAEMPDYRDTPDPEYMNERVRGTGGLLVTSFGEENLLSLAGDRYDDESIALHEFCHTIDAALRRLEPDWRQRVRETYLRAMDKGLWKNAYAASNPAEYWAEICQCYFGCNRTNNWNHGPIGSREELKRYDPEGYELVRNAFRLTPEQDFAFRPLRGQPSVVRPPAKLKVDAYYTRYTPAHGFMVLGSAKASDAALLKANETIRKMFTYRHDILKVLIDDGSRVVVLGRQEKLGDLPEFTDLRGVAGADEVRYADYTPRRKVIVVPEETLLGLPGEPFSGQCVLIGQMARAAYELAGRRPADPDFDSRPKQQYELRVKRMDAAFDQRLGKLFDEAATRGLWKGTTAARNRGEYWSAGVEAYFDAAGAGQPPVGADRPITTREALRAYDPGLFELVDETMAYRERVDWRWKPSGASNP